MRLYSIDTTTGHGKGTIKMCLLDAVKGHDAAIDQSDNRSELTSLKIK